MKTFYLPDLGEGLAEAEIREWYVKAGDQVKVDQPLVSMETAKAVVDVPSPYAGTISELHGKAHEIIKTGAPLISYQADGNASETTTAEKQPAKGSVVGSLEESAQSWQENKAIIGGNKSKTASIKAMPAARVLASQLNVDLKSIKGTGPQGLIRPEDVKAHINKSVTEGSTTAGNTEVLHGVRRFMAQAMTQSHQEIVPVTIIDDANISELPKDTDLTAKLLQAIAAAAKQEPALNAWFDGKTLERKLFNEINVGMAIDSTEGLFVPVIKDVDNKSVGDLRKLIDEYKRTVKDRTIASSDMQGATITLSNFGSISGRYATPIIVPPAVAILGVGRTREIPMVQDGKVIVGKQMPLSLTFDHRAVTGGEATRFLGAVIKYLENES